MAPVLLNLVVYSCTAVTYSCNSIRLYHGLYVWCDARDARDTVSLGNGKLFISGSCPILFLMTILGRPRRADAKTSIKNYQGQPLPKKMRFENI